MITNGKNRLTFGGDQVPDTDSGSLSTSFNIAKYDIFGDLSALPCSQSPAAFQATRRNEMPTIGINPLRFENDPADTKIRIRIRINPKIRIRIPDNFWLMLDALAELCCLRQIWPKVRTIKSKNRIVNILVRPSSTETKETRGEVCCV